MTAARWQCLNSWLLLGFVALLIVVPWGYAAVPLIATGAAILGAPGVNGRLVRLDSEDAWWCVVLLIFAGIWLMDVWETGHWPQTEEGEGIALPIWPALAAGLLVWLRCHEPAACHWWLGICAGALGACVVALYDRLVLAQPRAGIEINAIPFGNLALLLGFLSLMAVLWWSCRGPRGGRSRWLLSLALLGALSGFLASLLSGTRGGWVAVPCLAGLFAFSWWRMPSPGVRRLVPWKGLVTGIGLLLVVVMIPQTGVSGRVGEAVEQAQNVLAGEAREDSVGVRLEMWRGGVTLFCERPWIGWGEGRLESERDALVSRGLLHPGVSYYDHLHSDLIDTAARRGVMGSLALGLLYGIPLWRFSRRLVSTDNGTRVLAMAGVMIPVTFILFGLTQTMLRDPRGLSGYLGMCIGCWAVLRGEELKRGRAEMGREGPDSSQPRRRRRQMP